MRVINILLLLSLSLFSCQTTATPAAKPGSEKASVASNTQSDESYKVSKEKYDDSLKQIQELTQKLNSIIQSEDFDTWISYLDQDYIREYSDPQHLHTVTQNSPVLKKLNIKLTTLKDYFTFVVVPSRSNAHTDDISFLDEQRVEAWMMIKGEKALLYQLKLYDKQWKISSW